MPFVLARPLESATMLHGRLDVATRERITGWAVGEDPYSPVGLQILDNGAPIAWALANAYRDDLAVAGGRCSFEATIPGGLSPLDRCVITVQRDSDGAMLPGSPTVIEAADCFGDALRYASPWRSHRYVNMTNTRNPTGLGGAPHPPAGAGLAGAWTYKATLHTIVPRPA